MKIKEFKIFYRNLLNYFLSLFSRSKVIKTKKIKFISKEIIENIFNNHSIKDEYEQKKIRIDMLNLPEFTGGANSGDQKALYYFVSYYKPKNILELGTHIGCSTVNIASAIDKDILNKMITVDSVDVNSNKNKIWLKYNSPNSPKENLKNLGLDQKVEFIISNTKKFLTNYKFNFDFIFIDAGHQYWNIYNDLLLSIKLLNNEGFLIIHDYYKNNHFNVNKIKMNGPYLAVKKILKTNNNLRILEIKELPWQTKKDSKSTSLAILYRVNI